MKTLLLFFTCLIIYTDCFNQTNDSVLVWKVHFNMKALPQGDSNIMHGVNLKSVTYYINNNLVLRKEDDSNQRRKQVDSAFFNTSTSKKSKIGVVTRITVLNPVYLINLDCKIVYTYCKDDSTYYAALDSLKNHFDDFLYRISILDSLKNKLLVKENGSDAAQNIAGYKTYPAYANDNNGIIHFNISKSRNLFASPLNAFYPETSDNIFSVCFPPNHQSRGQRICLIIEEVKQMNVPTSFFEIPENFVKKSDIPMAKIVRDLFNPFN